MKRIMLSAVLSAFVVVFCLTGASAAGYNVTYLTTPAGFKSPKLMAINAFGVIAGTAQDNSGHTYAFVWERDGSVRELAMPAGYISCGIHDMNGLGQCAGYATDILSNGHAIAWDKDGTPRDLGALDGVYSVARSINAHGQIAGWSGAEDGSVHAMIWDMAGNVTDLGQAQGWGWSRAQGINDYGQVAGAFGDSTLSAFKLTGSSVKILGTRIDPGNSEAIALNSCGDAIVALSGLGKTPVLWKESGPNVPLDGLDSDIVFAWSINDADQVVGWRQLPSGIPPFPANHAIVWDSIGRATDINPAGMTSSIAYDINNNGRIVGTCSNGVNNYAVVWTPVPEPSCCLATGLGLLVLWMRKRRN